MLLYEKYDSAVEVCYGYLVECWHKKLMKPFHRKIKTPEEYEASMKLFSALMERTANSEGGGW